MTQPTNADLHVEFIFDDCLSSQWQQVFVGFEFIEQGSQTRIHGRIPDQPALFGLLKHIRDNNLNLVAFRILDESATP